MKKENWLLFLIAAFLLFTLKVNCDKNHAENIQNSQTTAIPKILPVLAQNKVATNPLVKPRAAVENVPRIDTKDFQEVSEEKSLSDKPYHKQQM